MKRVLSQENGLLIAPFFIILFVFFIPMSSSLKSIAAGLGLAAVILTPYYRKHLFESFNTLWGRAALALFAYVIIASLWSEAPFSMRLGVIDKYSKLIYLPILTVGFINPKTRLWALNSYFAIMLVTCVISLLKQKGILTLNNPEDTGEVFHNHIATGFMVALAVYFAAILFFNTQTNKWLRCYYLTMVLIGSYQIFFLNTGRTGYVVYGLLMSLLIMQKLSFKKAMLGIVLLGGSIGLMYVLSPLMQVRTAALISDIKFLQKHEENTSIGFRVQFHDYARSLFKRSPIFGIGTGGFKYNFSKEQPIPTWGPKLNDPHGQYWFTLVEQGIVGLVLFVIFLGTLYVTAFQLSSETRPLVLGMLIAFTMGSITDTIFCYSTAGSILIIICSMGFSEFITKKEISESKMVASPNGAKFAV